jgi:hypothetical protein
MCDVEWEFGNLWKRMANASRWLFKDFPRYEKMELHLCNLLLCANDTRTILYKKYFSK